MNWTSNSVDAVSKERIWREHVQTEKNTARIHVDFRVNPLKNDAPTTDFIVKRPARFLDRSKVIMDMLQQRLSRVKSNEERDRMRSAGAALERGSAAGATASSSAATTARVGASANATVAGALGAENALDASANNGARGNFQIRTRGMYGDSARVV